MRGTSRLTWVAVAACALIAALAPAAGARQAPAVPKLDWQPCGTAPNVVCTTATVPRDYDDPHGATVDLHLAKSPATDPTHRIGSLFINFGGPGASAADRFETRGQSYRPGLNARFDIIAMDPRGTGQSTPSIDCKVNQETQGIYSQPFPTPDNIKVPDLVGKDLRYIGRCLSLNKGILPHLSTANVARDIDLVREALGEDKITYFGYSYGTFLGATYASMFPTHYRAVVLDGPVDANAYINDPLRDLSAQSSGFERAFGRFMQACAANQTACSNFGGTDPWDAYDQLVDKLDQTPLTVGDRTLDGDDVRTGTVAELYSKSLWGALAQALAQAQNGDGTALRVMADGFYGGPLDDGTYDPANDRYFTIGASEQKYPRDVGTYVRAGQQSWDQHEHFWWNNGYVELNYGLYPARDRDAFDGPFHVPGASPTALVVGTTYDPATPYRGARNLVRSLGNARLLTMRGDGHTAYRNNPTNSDCINAAVEAYVNDATLPAPGTQCTQAIAFTAPAPATATARALAKRAATQSRPHAAPF
jgi:pimeloyl-ACP methyl ester carboxylesterase